MCLFFVTQQDMYTCILTHTRNTQAVSIFKTKFCVSMCISALAHMWSEPCLFPLDQNDWGIKLTALLCLITRFKICLPLPSLPCLLHGMVLDKAQGQLYIYRVLKPIELGEILSDELHTQSVEV